MWIEPNSLYSESWNEVRKNDSLVFTCNGGWLHMICWGYAPQVLRSSSDLQPLWSAAAVQGAQRCDLRVQQGKGPLRPYGPMCNHGLTQPRSTLLCCKPHDPVFDTEAFTCWDGQFGKGNMLSSALPASLSRTGCRCLIILLELFSFAALLPAEYCNHWLRVLSLFLALWASYCECLVEHNSLCPGSHT